MEKKKELLSIVNDGITAFEGFVNAAKEMVSHGEKLVKISKDIKELLIEDNTKTTKDAKEKTKKTENVTYTKEDVRAVLAEKSAAGFGKEVKELLTKYGADKLSTLSPESYEAVIAEAKEIKND